MGAGGPARQRRRARAILVALVLGLVFIVLFSSNPSGLSFAQPVLSSLLSSGSESSPSPTPSTSSPSPSASTSTATPSPTATQTTATPTATQTSASPSPSESTPPPPPPPPVRYPSTVKMRYDDNAFEGEVGSVTKRCRKERVVVVKKKRPGKDKKVGADITDRKGDFSVRERKANGTYFAVAARKSFIDRTGRQVVCSKDRSRNVNV